MANINDVIVWEWFDEYHRWRPYSPKVSNSLQKQFENVGTKSTSMSSILQLGTVDKALSAYEVDFATFTQLRSSTGMKRNIQQKVYPANGVIGQGVVWKWETDKPGIFHDYDIEAAEVLEQYYKQPKSPGTLDLNSTTCNLPYNINFAKMTQSRKGTNRVRRIKRETKGYGYVRFKDTNNSAIIKSGSVPYYSGGAHFPGNSLVNGAIGGGFGGGISTQNFGAIGGSVPLQQNAIFPPNSMTGMSVPGMYLPTTSAAVATTPLFPGSPYTPATTAPSVSIGSTRVTRSSVKKAAYSGSSYTTGIAVPVGWHPPMALPGGIETSNPTKPKKGKAKKLTKKVRPRLPAMGSISNTDTNGVAFGGAKAKKPKMKTSDFNHVIKGYAKVIRKPSSDDDCCICMCELTEVSGQNDQCNEVIGLKCSHMFHKSCLSAMYKSGTQDGSIQCPSCKTIYGVKFGNCPPGVMDYRKGPNPLPGYPDCGLIQISYNIPQGIQGKEHPNPGERYYTQGFPRIGYLPDNDDGEKILRLLIKAWKRRLTFTIGTSVTTGITNAVVWNEIHHKTEIVDHSGHGYPDPKYFDNVTMEMALQGVIDSEEEEESSSEEESESEDSDDDL